MERGNMTKVRVLVVGLGNMGLSHARAYKTIEGFEIVGLCSRGIESRDDLRSEFPGVACFSNYAEALQGLKPDAVSINTWPDTHAEYARMALEAGADVFIEKPLAGTVAEARAIAELAKAKGKRLVIGYILRVHPSWVKFVELGRTLGKPLVMRMNLNQQSSGAQWAAHQRPPAGMTLQQIMGVPVNEWGTDSMRTTKTVTVAATGSIQLDNSRNRLAGSVTGEGSGCNP
jgi:predicted dehydrogenase